MSLVLISITQWIPLMINGVVAKNYEIENAEIILFLVYSVYSAKVVFAYRHNEGLTALLMGLILGIPFGAFF